MSPLRIAALVSHPIQYQAPLFRRVASAPDVDLTVYFCSRQGVDAVVDEGFGQEVVWDVPLLEGYDHEFLRDWSPAGGAGSSLRFNPGIVSRLRTGDHDVLWVHGYESLTDWTAFAVASLDGVGTVLRGETTPPASGEASPLKRRLLDGLFRSIDAFAYIGERNRRFYEGFGIPDERLFEAPYTVNNEFFQEQRGDLPPREALCEDAGVDPDRPVVLFVGKLVERKRPVVLLDAFCQATVPNEATLLFVGDGDRATTLERRAGELDRRDDVAFAGFVNQSELPRYYELADVFALPSAQENWGLVVNEAMNFALPVVTTGAVGSSTDLVDQRNGRVCPVDDVSALSAALSEILEDEDVLTEMGRASKARIDDWGIDETAAGILRAARYASE